MKRFLLMGFAMLCAASGAAAQRVNNLKVLSQHVDDVTTAENILRSLVKPGMNEAERAKAIWTACVKYRHQTSPPNEFFAADWEAHDPVKIFNVYGYCMCCCTSALITALNRLDGREARGRILNGHSVAETRYGGGWRMFDPSLINYFPRADGEVASVDEIAEVVRGWLDKNPDLRGNNEKLMAFMRANKWEGWRRGPELLARSPFYRQGWFPAGTHGWASTMQEYDRVSEVYEYGYQIGHRALFSLRPGESFTREAGNRGLHVNGDLDWDGLTARAPEGDLVWMKEFFPAYRGPLVGNGMHRYAPDLAAGGLAQGAEVYENLTGGRDSPALRPKTSGRAAVAVVEMRSPYVYLGGRVSVKAFRKTAADKIALSISTDNGRNFVPLWSAEQLGGSEATMDLREKILRRYAYWLKIELTSATLTGAGLDALVIENDFQHSPRTLPFLAKGDNQITVAADGGDTTIATRSVVCRNTNITNFRKNETADALGVVYENVRRDDGWAWFTGTIGTVTVPVETAGEMVALRFGAQIRARESEKERVRILLSFDDGNTWLEGGKISGPTQGQTEYFRFDKIPSGVKRALVRFLLEGRKWGTVGLANFRVDADYRDLLAARKKCPFTVMHHWRENGAEKSFSQKIETLPFAYFIPVAVEPEMISVSYQMPAL